MFAVNDSIKHPNGVRNWLTLDRFKKLLFIVWKSLDEVNQWPRCPVFYFRVTFHKPQY